MASIAIRLIAPLVTLENAVWLAGRSFDLFFINTTWCSLRENYFEAIVKFARFLIDGNTNLPDTDDCVNHTCANGGLCVDGVNSILRVITIYSFSNDRRLTFAFFLHSYQICCVYVSIAPHYYDFDFKLTSDAKIQPVFLKYRRGRPFLTMVTCWSRSTSNFYVLIG